MSLAVVNASHDKRRISQTAIASEAIASEAIAVHGSD
jgi:hypothetical protein